LHYGTDGRRIGFFLRHIRLFFADFELMDQTVQVTARYAESPRALGLPPAVFPERAENQVPLKAADFVLAGRDRCFGVELSGGNRRRHGLLSRSDRAHRNWKLWQLDARTFGQNHGSLDDIFQLPDIAGPVVLLEGLQHGWRKTASLLVKLLRRSLQEVMRQ